MSPQKMFTQPETATGVRKETINGQRDNGYTLRVFNLVWEWQIPESQPQGSGNKDDISIYFETT